MKIVICGTGDKSKVVNSFNLCNSNNVIMLQNELDLLAQAIYDFRRSVQTLHDVVVMNNIEQALNDAMKDYNEIYYVADKEQDLFQEENDEMNDIYEMIFSNKNLKIFKC